MSRCRKVASFFFQSLSPITTAAVPVPTIKKSCEEEKGSCELTCDGDTTEAEPVTYKWKLDNKDKADFSEKQYTVQVSFTLCVFVLFSLFVAGLFSESYVLCMRLRIQLRYSLKNASRRERGSSF